jgi:hypothetical protein
MNDQDKGNLSPWGEEETLGPATSLPWGESATVDGGRMFLLLGDDPLPDGVKEGDEGVSVIRVVAATREDVEAADAAS